MPDPPSPREAIALLKRLTALPGHAFWPDNLSIVDALAGDTLIATHHQVRDGYLLRLAVVHEGILATLDRGIQPIARGYPDRLEIIL